MAKLNAVELDLIAELILIGLRRLAELNEALARMRAGSQEEANAEIERAGLAAEAAILRARNEINADPGI